MDYTDDEQVEKLKAWWKTYGYALIAGVVLGLGILYGGKYWKQQQLQNSAEASALFDQLVFQVQKKDNASIKSIGSKIVEQYQRTPYAGLTALILSRLSYDEKDKDRAKQQLIWAMDNAREEGVRQVARIRLGRVLLAENNADAAIALLSDPPVTGFEFEHYELEGDIQGKRGNVEAARSAYQKALSSAGDIGEYASVIRMKLDNLG